MASWYCMADPLAAHNYERCAKMKRLDEVCGDSERKQQWFPKSPSQLGSKLTEIAPLLRPRGIEFRRYKIGRSRDRRIVLRCASEAVYEELRARITGQWPTTADHLLG